MTVPSDNPVIISSRHLAPRHSLPGLEHSYRMIRLIGRGTMSSVYLAEQLSMARLVALKILSPALAADKSFVERFLREARASARLNHPNIVTALDFGEIDNRFFLAMEYVDGITLAARLDSGAPMEEEEVVRVALQVLSALKHAASHHVIHLDIKPANIMIAKDDTVKLTDFGLAMLLDSPGGAEASRKAVGTPYYMAPEQVEGAKLDWRTDQYGLGASLYEAATGRKPFLGNSVSDILIKRFFEKPEPAWKVGKHKVSRGFSAVLSKMLSRSPDGRYQSFTDLENDLQLVLAGKKPLVAQINSMSGTSLPSASSLNSLGYSTVIERIDGMAWKRRRNWIVISSGVVLCLLATYAGLRAKTLLGPKPPTTDRAKIAVEAEVLPPDQYRAARDLWRKAIRGAIRAEKTTDTADIQWALQDFRSLTQNREFRDTVYFMASRQNVDYLERKLARHLANGGGGGAETNADK